MGRGSEMFKLFTPKKDLNLKGGVKEIQNPLLEERNQATSHWENKNKLVSSSQKQHNIPIIEIIFATIFGKKTNYAPSFSNYQSIYPSTTIKSTFMQYL